MVVWSAGTWQGQPVAVKVITHSRADDTRISQELTLSISFDHPNLVRALHYVKVDINPRSPELSEVGDGLCFEAVLLWLDTTLWCRMCGANVYAKH